MPQKSSSPLQRLLKAVARWNDKKWVYTKEGKGYAGQRMEPERQKRPDYRSGEGNRRGPQHLSLLKNAVKSS